ncbi:YigZ family protein [Terrilactibacillus laevilacticus]|uniref:YigZ family protein n=1 Tax=Terrilactibacillus laevilacticus TaxID=1380157 RepID=UPI0011461836|nr:YigZ family protein [Terrilactibacillus laevilacticus]
MVEVRQYKTIKEKAIHEIDIQKSRFIAHIFPVTSEDEAKACIERIRKEHWKATHNCFAYTVGENQAIQKASDDGEPTGTAGVPILEVLKKQHLEDTLVIVTRYFGGIKLGAGGLIRAYSNSTSEGLKVAKIIERIPSQTIRINIAYPLLGSIENALRQSPYSVKGMHYAENVLIDVYVKLEEIDLFKNWMTDITNAQCQIETIETGYLDKIIEN